jgi:hypothetical protein
MYKVWYLAGGTWCYEFFGMLDTKAFQALIEYYTNLPKSRAWLEYKSITRENNR